MVSGRQRSATERGELRRRACTEVGRVSERIRMVLRSDRRYTVPQIAAIFECGEANVRGWLARFDAEGVAGLYDRPRAGRPRPPSAAAHETIRRALDTTPAAAGSGFSFWTVVTRCARLAQRCGLSLSRATVRRVVRALDYRWRRPHHYLPTDPAAAPKLWALCTRLIRAPAEAVILCQDECDLPLLPVLRAMWMRRGEPVRVPTPGANRRRAVFGALEWTTGRWLYAITERKRAVEFIAFLEQVLSAYPARPVLVVVDHASIHTAKAVCLWLAEHLRLELLVVPTASGHAENPVEKVWGRLKGHVAATRLHGNIDALVVAVHDFFASFTPADARRVAA